jgi:hypothetical protein
MAKTRKPITGYQVPKGVNDILAQAENAKITKAWCDCNGFSAATSSDGSGRPCCCGNAWAAGAKLIH